MSFDFVPRTVGKSKPRSNLPSASVAATTSRVAIAAVQGPQPVHVPPVQSTASSSAQKTPKLSSDGIDLLVGLALSDYALWTTPALRDPNKDGYVALASLMTTSPAFADASLSEAAVVKALREHAPDVYDIRMILASSSKHGLSGGYEIRRRDWENTVAAFPTHTRALWQENAIYVERLPPSARSRASILHLFKVLLPNTSNAIQVVTFLAHHQDLPSADPKCKGFALLTLKSKDDAEKILHDWPWKNQTATPGNKNEAGEGLVNEAQRAGMRTLAKAAWDKLQDEYLAYRTKLVDEMARSEERPPTVAEDTLLRQSVSKKKRRASSPRPPLSPAKCELAPAEAATTLTAESPFPPGCVVRVKNIFPATNKTTLRTLFSVSGAEMDYVDYIKGLDSCYLRVAASSHAHKLVEHFTSNPTVQKDALDATGAPASGEQLRPLSLELLNGRQEEVYWGQVPEKVRNQAVMKALKTSNLGGDDAEEVESAPKGTRKRRRHK